MPKTSKNPINDMTKMTRRMADRQLRQARNFWEPFLSMQQDMQQQMNDMIMQTMGGLPFSGSVPSFSGLPGTGKVMPKVKVWEDSKTFYLETKVPGIDPKDIEVSVKDNAMTITCGGKKPGAQAGRGETLYQKKNACRTVMIPDNANAAKADAEIMDETLLVTIPKKKTKKSESKKITVKQAA